MNMNVNKAEQRLVADKQKIKLLYCRRQRYFATGNSECQYLVSCNFTSEALDHLNKNNDIVSCNFLQKKFCASGSSNNIFLLGIL